MPFPEFTGCIAKNINIKSDLKRQKKKKSPYAEILIIWTLHPLFEACKSGFKGFSDDWHAVLGAIPISYKGTCTVFVLVGTIA